MGNGIEERLQLLEQRVRQLEDEREVSRLVASYGPLVDSGQADAVAELWDSDGVYDVDELFMKGREQIAAMVRSPQHQSWISGGCGHLLLPPSVSVTGDAAVAVCYSLMVVHRDDRFVVRRLTANHWRLRRGVDGWRVTTRTSRVLDGRPESPALLGGALDVATP